MTRWITKTVLALGFVAFVAAPGISHAGAMLKEHECVGKDTSWDKSKGEEDAGCTPLGSEIFPPEGAGVYGAEDMDENDAVEEFEPRGALEVLGPVGNMWQTIPTIKESGFKQAGFPAYMRWEMLVKSSSVLSDLEVVCSVCAERPQNTGPGQTFADPRRRTCKAGADAGACVDGDAVEVEGGGKGGFNHRLHIRQRPWKLSATHHCSLANPLRQYGECGGYLVPKTTPGLYPTKFRGVTFMGCKPTVVLFENRGEFFQGDTIEVKIKVPASARVSGMFDVTSCEVNYIRACLPGEGFFKPICVGEP